MEILLPQLQMQCVDAVMLPSRLFVEPSSASKLPLAPVDLLKVSGLPAIASISGAGALVVAANKRIPPALAKTLGIESWT